jgi:hypothetical protein
MVNETGPQTLMRYASSIGDSEFIVQKNFITIMILSTVYHSIVKDGNPLATTIQNIYDDSDQKYFKMTARDIGFIDSAITDISKPVKLSDIRIKVKTFDGSQWVSSVDSDSIRFAFDFSVSGKECL